MDYFKQESHRLIFRKLTEDDIDVWSNFFENNDRLKYLGIDISLDKYTLARNWILKQKERYENGLGHLAVELKSEGTFIGVGGILPREIDGKKEYEIAYSVLPEFWKNGYGTEIAMQIKKSGQELLNPKRFISIIDKRNKDSIHVAKKNNMQVIAETTFLGMDVYIYGEVYK